MSASLGQPFFDSIYAADPDPWRFATSDYEREKYRVTLAALSRPHYVRGLDVGCSIGVLTRQLAGRCCELVAIDITEKPLAEARRRSADAPWVRFARMAAPGEWPDGAFDLIVLSEVVYYLSRDEVAALARRIVASLGAGGDLVLVHWTGATNYPLTGDEAATLLLREAAPVLRDVRSRRFDSYRLDVARRA